MDELLLDQPLFTTWTRVKLKQQRHWRYIRPEFYVRGSKYPKDRELLPEIIEWLEETGISYYVSWQNTVGNKLWFEKPGDAIMFKLAWK